MADPLNLKSQGLSIYMSEHLHALQALRKVPEVNASWNTEFIRQYHNIDVSVAVQTPGGLMVPIVHDADALGLSEISAKVKDLATKVMRIPMLCEVPLMRRH